MKRKKHHESNGMLVSEFCKKAAQKKSSVFIGIDPGSSGAIAFRCHNLYCVVDIPTFKVKRNKGNRTVANYPAIIEIFRNVRNHLGGKLHEGSVHAIIEEAQSKVAGSRAGAFAALSLGISFGMWPLFLLSLGISVSIERPHIWKGKMGLRGKDKETSRFKAQNLFPQAELHRKKDHDRAEALLIAEFLKKTHRKV